ncbi:hypothetical protein ACLOJK_004148, partial [Asimina triloba]
DATFGHILWTMDFCLIEVGLLAFDVVLYGQVATFRWGLLMVGWQATGWLAGREDADGGWRLMVPCSLPSDLAGGEGRAALLARAEGMQMGCLTIGSWSSASDGEDGGVPVGSCGAAGRVWAGADGGAGLDESIVDGRMSATGRQRIGDGRCSSAAVGWKEMGFGGGRGGRLVMEKMECGRSSVVLDLPSPSLVEDGEGSAMAG